MSKRQAKQKVIDFMAQNRHSEALTIALEYKFPQSWIDRIMQVIFEEVRKVIMNAEEVIGTINDPVVAERERIIEEMAKERREKRSQAKESLLGPKLKGLLMNKLWARAHEFATQNDLEVPKIYLKEGSGYSRYVARVNK